MTCQDPQKRIYWHKVKQNNNLRKAFDKGILRAQFCELQFNVSLCSCKLGSLPPATYPFPLACVVFSVFPPLTDVSGEMKLVNKKSASTRPSMATNNSLPADLESAEWIAGPPEDAAEPALST